MAKYIVGQLVEFAADRFQGDYDQGEDYNKKYKKGGKGYVLDVHTSDHGMFYTVKVGMSDIIEVPEADLIDPNATIRGKVEARLRAAQESKAFKDTEGRIGGSKKEKMAYKMILTGDLDNIEKDEATAIELVKKDKVYPKVDIPGLQAAGVSAGAAYLLVKMRESFGSAPPNSAEKRKVYVGYVAYLVAHFSDVITVKAFEDKAGNLLSNGLYQFITILLPKDQLEQINAERTRNANELEAIDKFIKEKGELLSDERDKIKNAHAELWNEEKNIFRWQDVPSDEKKKYDQLDADIDELKKDRRKFSGELTSIEQDFIKKMGLSGGYYSATYLGKQLFEEVFGSRFVNFIGKGSSPVVQTYEQAKDYEGLSKDESDKFIEEENKRDYEWIEKYNIQLAKIEQLSSKEEHEEFFKEHGNMGFSGGDFARFGRGYFYWKDIRGVEQIEAYKKRYVLSLQESIRKYEKRITEVQQKFRVRENNWDWAFAKGNGQGTGKERVELKANQYPPLSYIKRDGGIKITELDVTVESIRAKFGFKEVEFGQSIKDTEAKEHIRHFLGAMADLGDILNMDIVALNKLGGLSIAFASRGGGKASAHYESLRKVINITKSRGGGAVAHEWMHYLDNVLPKIGNDQYTYNSWASVTHIGDYRPTASVKNADVYKAMYSIFDYIYNRKMPDLFDMSGKQINEGSVKDEKVFIKVMVQASLKSFAIPTAFGYPRVTPVDIDEYFRLFKQSYSQYRFSDNLKKKDFEVLGAIVHKFGFKEYEFTFESKKTSYYSHSAAMSSDYWSREWELLARAFETYIFDKLDKAGRSNNYLVSGAYFERAEGVYPAGAERADLFLLFDNLMMIIKREYAIGDFKPWTTERTKEYMDLAEDKKEEVVDAGIIVDAVSGVVEKVLGDTGPIKSKLKHFIGILNMKKMQQGGTVVTHESITYTLHKFLLN